MSEEETTVSGETREAAAPTAEQHHDEPEAQSEKVVPLTALEAERSQRQQLQDELRMIKDHLALMQQGQNRQSEPQEPQYQDDDVMTFGDFKKAASKFQNEIKMTIGELQMVKRHPDYEEVVKKYLPDIVKNRPKIGQYLQQTQDYEYAYEVAKSSQAYQRDHHQRQQNADAERLMQNSQKAGSLSSMGSTSPINMAKRYKDMNESDFRREVAKNMGYA